MIGEEDKISSGPGSRELARTFLHLGVTAYGGLAMVEPIRRRVVQEKGWLSRQDFLDGLALCQLLPGATVVQLTTYVGYRLRGVPGALAAAAGFILPAFLLMLALSALYCRYGEISWVKSVSHGFKAMVIALLLQTLWRFQEIIRGRLDLGIAVLTLGALGAGADYLLVFLAAGLLRLAVDWKFARPTRPVRPGPPLPVPYPGLFVVQITGTLMVLTLLVWGLGQWRPNLGPMSFIFLKTGVVSFGGGYAMIPILQWEIVDNLHWLTAPQFLDGILLGFVTPGPIVVTAVFIGYWVQGLVGAVVGAIAIFLPPILMIVFLTPYYQ